MVWTPPRAPGLGCRASLPKLRFFPPMAMTQCRECGHQVSTKAEACPGCGAKPKTSSFFFKLVVFGVLLIVVVFAVGVAVNPKQDVEMLTVDATTGAKVRPESLAMAVSPEAPATVQAEPAAKAEPPVEPPGSQWDYSEMADKMGKGVVRGAKLYSTNEVEFDFPYHQPQRARLVLRNHPRHGKDVIFSIERGQLQCPPFEGCKVLVRFDDEPAVSYSGTSPEDHSSETLFIENYARFYEKLSKAQRVRISVSVFRQGSPMFEFDLRGFNPARYKGEQQQ